MYYGNSPASQRESRQKQQELADIREVENIIENRKKTSAEWLKTVMKTPAVEEQYRKRLLRAKQEERRLAEQREHALNRNPDPRFPPTPATAAASSFGNNVNVNTTTTSVI